MFKNWPVITSCSFTSRVYNIVKLINGIPDTPTQVAAPTIELSIILQMYNTLHLHVICLFNLVLNCNVLLNLFRVFFFAYI